MLYNHFVRGYFDGDGSLIFSRRKSTGKKDLNFSIVSTKEMLNVIRILFLDLEVNSSINKRHKKRENNNFTLRVFGKRQIKTICDYLYNGATVFMERKYKTYLQLLDLSKS